MFVERVVEPRIGIVHNVLFTEFGRVRVVSPDGKGNNSDHKNQVDDQDQVAVFRLEQPVRQSNTDFEGLLSVGVSVFFPVFFRLRICEGFVCLGDHHELSFGFSVARVLIGMVLERERSVRFLNHFVVRPSVDVQNIKGIKRIHFSVLGDIGQQPKEEERQKNSNDEIVFKLFALEKGGNSRILFQSICLLLFGTGSGDGSNGGIVGAHGLSETSKYVNP
mmetsp:Transcript_10577/g.26691  ORF Transcript_10577/g.26691 Transcript_10577/m.26691 type:complete len:220 (+) Transcript_10577:3-662(+)